MGLIYLWCETVNCPASRIQNPTADEDVMRDRWNRTDYS